MCHQLMPRTAKHYRRLLPGASRLLCFSVLQRVHQSCKTSRKLRNGWVVEWEWIFQRKVMFTCRSKSRLFFAEAELRKFKSQYIVLNWGTSSHRLFCVRKQNCWTSRHSIFLVRKRNFKPKNIPCVEAEMQNFKSHNSLCTEAELQET